METTFTVRRMDEPTLGLTEADLKALNLREGQQVTLALPRGPRRASPEAIADFLSLIGVFADAPEFEDIMRDIREGFNTWDRRIDEYVSTLDS